MREYTNWEALREVKRRRDGVSPWECSSGSAELHLWAIGLTPFVKNKDDEPELKSQIFLWYKMKKDCCCYFMRCLIWSHTSSDFIYLFIYLFSRVCFSLCSGNLIFKVGYFYKEKKIDIFIRAWPNCEIGEP